MERKRFTNTDIGISGVVPDGWVEDQPGVWLRHASENNPTYLVQQRVKGLSVAEVMAMVMSKEGLGPFDEYPAHVGTIETPDSIWDWYRGKASVPVPKTVDIALSQRGNTVYIVALGTSPGEIDGLHETVFLPVVKALAPAYDVEYMRQLRNILVYLGVCDGNMQEGSLRCDANVSVMPNGSNKFGTRTELKNMNSFRHIQRALSYEIDRQTKLCECGEEVVQETRLWDVNQGITISMRGKEEAHDYRYFPDPDLVPMAIGQEWIERVRASLPELPEEKKERFIREYQIPEYDAEVLTTSKPLANYFEACLSSFPKPKIVSNWIMSELLRELKRDEREIEECPVPAGNLAPGNWPRKIFQPLRLTSRANSTHFR
jgi:hypothetical protein